MTARSERTRAKVLRESQRDAYDEGIEQAIEMGRISEADAVELRAANPYRQAQNRT